jgi:hypothetical protein
MMIIIINYDILNPYKSKLIQVIVTFLSFCDILIFIIIIIQYLIKHLNAFKCF